MRKKSSTLNVFVQKISNIKVILLFLVLFMLVAVLVNVVFKQDFEYLTQTFNYSPQVAYQRLNAIGITGRSSHLKVFIADLIMVILYTFLLIGTNYYVLISSLKIVQLLVY